MRVKNHIKHIIILFALWLSSEPGFANGDIQPEAATGDVVQDIDSYNSNRQNPIAESSDEKPVLVQDPPGLPNQNTRPKTSKVERAVMPFTQWVEEKIQNISIIKPSTHNREKRKQVLQGISLREAIEKAQENYSGTVLSAERLQEGDVLVYHIKILSGDGVVRIVKVNGSDKN